MSQYQKFVKDYFKNQDSRWRCQKVYLKNYRPKNKKAGDLCGESTLGSKYCLLHHCTTYQMIKNQERIARLKIPRSIRSTRIANKLKRRASSPKPIQESIQESTESSIAAESSGIEIIIKKIYE